MLRASIDGQDVEGLAFNSGGSALFSAKALDWGQFANFSTSFCGSNLVPKTRVFTSFDFDHDEDLRNLLVGQSKNPDSPFEMSDWSVKESMSGDWKQKARSRIKASNQMIVLCGAHTNTASGVSIELRIAQEEGLPYFLLAGRSGKPNLKPEAAKASDKMYKWTWDNLKALLSGSR